MESGFYLMVQRNGRWKSLDITEMTLKEIRDLFITRPPEELVQWINGLARRIENIKEE